MDILKEIFGTSDELQISKSLFESEDGHDHQPLSMSLEHGEAAQEPVSQPLPLLPTDPRPPLVRSQSLDDIHAASSSSSAPSSSEEKDPLTGVCRTESFRPHSAFPHLSDKAGTTPVDLHTVPHEMPMYLLQEDEGNDEEIMQLLGTSESGRALRGASADRNDVMMRSLRASRWNESRHTNPMPGMNPVIEHIHQLEKPVVALETATNVCVNKLISETVELLPGDLSEQVCDCIDSSSDPSSIEVSNFVTVDSNSTELDSSNESHRDTVQNSPIEVSRSMLSSVITQSKALSSTSLDTHRETSVLPISLPSVPFENEHGLPSNLVTAVPSSTSSTSVTTVEGAFSRIASSSSSPQVQAIPSFVRMSSGETNTVTLSPSWQRSVAAPKVNEGTQTSSAVLPQAQASSPNINHANCSTPPTTAIVAPLLYPNTLHSLQAPLNLSTSVLRALNEILQSTPLQTSVGDVDIQQLIDRNPRIATPPSVTAETNTLNPGPSSGDLVQQKSVSELHSPAGIPTMPIVTGTLKEAVQPNLSQSLNTVEADMMVPSSISGPSSSIVDPATSQSILTPSDVSGEHVDKKSLIEDDDRRMTSPQESEAVPQANESQTITQHTTTSPSGSSSKPEDSANNANTSAHLHTKAVDTSTGVSSEGNPGVTQPRSQSVDSESTTQDRPQNDVEDMDTGLPSDTITSPPPPPPPPPPPAPPASHPLDLLMQNSFEVCVQWQGMKVGAGGSFMGLAATPVQILPGAMTRESRDTPPPPPSLPLPPLANTHKEPNSQTVKKSPSKSTGKRRHAGGWPKGKKRKTDTEIKKPPKAPLSGYNIFLSERRSEVQRPGMPMSTVSKLLGQKWSQISKEEKQKFYSRAERDRQRYLSQLKQYLRESHEAASDVEQNNLDRFLEQSFANEANSELLVCDTCGLVFASLSNKRTHFNGKLHMEAILKQMSLISRRKAVTSRSQTPQSPIIDEGEKNFSSLVSQEESASISNGNCISDMEVEKSPPLDQSRRKNGVQGEDDVVGSLQENHKTLQSQQLPEVTIRSTDVPTANAELTLCASSRESDRAVLPTDHSEKTCTHEVSQNINDTSDIVPTINSSGVDIISHATSNEPAHIGRLKSSSALIDSQMQQPNADEQLSETFQSLACSYLKLSETRKSNHVLLEHYADLQQQTGELEEILSEQDDAFRELAGLCAHSHDSLRRLQLAVLSLIRKY